MNYLTYYEGVTKITAFTYKEIENGDAVGKV